MDWAEQRAQLLAGKLDPPPEMPPDPPPGDDRTRPLLVSELLGIVDVVLRGGDGTIPVRTWEPPDDADKHWHHVTRQVRVLTKEAAEEIRSAEPPWLIHTSVKSVGDGWLAITDPITGEVYEIRVADAHSAWLTTAARATSTGGRAP